MIPGELKKKARVLAVEKLADDLDKADGAKESLIENLREASRIVKSWPAWQKRDREYSKKLLDKFFASVSDDELSEMVSDVKRTDRRSSV